MIHYYREFLIYAGERFSVYFHAGTPGASEAYGHFERSSLATQASLLFLVKRMADTGRIWDETKFRIEDRENRVYCFKPRDDRFFCFFFRERSIIITSAYRKKGRKLDRRELARAIAIRSLYYE
jgi:hypothetical protein